MDHSSSLHRWQLWHLGDTTVHAVRLWPDVCRTRRVLPGLLQQWRVLSLRVRPEWRWTGLWELRCESVSFCWDLRGVFSGVSVCCRLCRVHVQG